MPFPGPNVESTVLTATAFLPGAGRTMVPLYTLLASLVAGDTLVMPLNFRGRIVALDFVTLAKVTTAGKAATLTGRLRTGGVVTAMTGGVLTLTSALATPEGATIASTAITGNNVFRGVAGDALILTVSGLTAFTEGSGNVWVTYVNDDTLGTIERVGLLFPSSG